MEEKQKGGEYNASCKDRTKDEKKNSRWKKRKMRCDVGIKERRGAPHRSIF